jgi:hypothetical protein
MTGLLELPVIATRSSSRVHTNYVGPCIRTCHTNVIPNTRVTASAYGRYQCQLHTLSGSQHLHICFCSWFPLLVSPNCKHGRLGQPRGRFNCCHRLPGVACRQDSMVTQGPPAGEEICKFFNIAPLNSSNTWLCGSSEFSHLPARPPNAPCLRPSHRAGRYYQEAPSTNTSSHAAVISNEGTQLTFNVLYRCQADSYTKLSDS